MLQGMLTLHLDEVSVQARGQKGGSNPGQSMGQQATCTILTQLYSGRTGRAFSWSSKLTLATS